MARTNNGKWWWMLALLLPLACTRQHDDLAYTRVQPLPLPVTGRAAQADLLATPQGDFLLGWVQPLAEAAARPDAAEAKPHQMMSSRSRPGEAWSTPRQVAAGSDWFLNWADTPHLYALADGSLWAHWLRSTGPGRMDYGIALTHSRDQGQHWSPPTQVELADSPGDHGFVTFWPQPAGGLGLAWLDSRQKAAAGMTGHDEDAGAGHDHGGAAAMMLRAAVFDANGQRQGEWPLDTSTCDCCTTSSAMTPQGPVVAYRGRTRDEIRDIRVVRWQAGQWSPPRTVHPDGWQIAGCPVNGPAVVADGTAVWVAWYTEADGLPELRVARSDDSGDSFGTPITVAKGAQVLGRVAAAHADGQLLLVWLEERKEGGQAVMLARYDDRLSERRLLEVGRSQARGRASGLPRLALQPGEARVVWTDVVDGAPVLRGARVY